MVVERVRIALVSSSPRRREILEMVGFNFRVVKVEAEEGVESSPSLTAVKNAESKVLAAKGLIEEGEVGLAADTIVVLDGKVLGKPSDERDAVEFLKELSGRWHTVITGFALLFGGRLISGFEEAKVKFKRLTLREIEWYVSTGEPMDKAGAYGIQGKGALFIETLEGDFFTVMGLPVGRIYDILELELKNGGR
ncbi:nucleoside triphosphate pyrophosphatase [Thermovibrio sp.]